MKNISTKFAFTIIAFFSFLAITACFEVYFVLAKKQMSVKYAYNLYPLSTRTLLPCTPTIIDTVWHGHGKLEYMYADYAGSRMQEYDLLLKRDGCIINQQIVIELDPMENHSEIIN
jgi:hypothetical protein